METPLQEVNVCRRSLTAFEALCILLDITRSIIGGRPGQGEDELRVGFGGVVHPQIRFDGDNGAQRELIVGVPKTPNHLKLFHRELGYFSEVKV